MRSWILRRRWSCAWLAAVLLYAQVAAAAYACPAFAPPGAADRAQAAAASAAMHDCAGRAPGEMDPAQPLLCKAHCQPEGQSVNSTPGVSDVLPAALFDAVLERVLDAAHAEALAAAMPVAQAAGPPAGAPPLYLSLLVLRI